MRMTALRRTHNRRSGQEGFTMIVAVGVLFVSSLLLLAAFTAASGDIDLSHKDTTQKQAYYAALAGIQEYQYKLQNNPNYWQTCEHPGATISGEERESYEVKLLPASSQPKGTVCSTTSPFTTMIESSGPLANTFRIQSTGTAGNSKRSIVATFQVAGFLNYVYFTQYEVEDPTMYGGDSRCENYYAQRQSLGVKCVSITFIKEDSVFGPMHTDDAALVCGEVEFGRAGHVPPDVAEINGGTVSAGCGGNPVFNTPTETYIVGEELVAPESDTSLRSYVEAENQFTGLTTLVLEGAKDKITVTNANFHGGAPTSIEWPKNGLIFVQSSASPACNYEYDPEGADTTETAKEEIPCGSVFVKGEFKKSLTIAAETDVVINGSITESGVAAGSEPTGTAVLGLIATRDVRIYHPCESSPVTNPWIYAAILSTSHSMVVDNFNCGNGLGKLNIYGAIAQKYRGIVGQGRAGFLKNYNYDGRLATDEPPYFLSPIKAGWRVVRETSPTAG